MSAPRPLLGRHRGPCHYPHSPYDDTADDADHRDDDVHCDADDHCDDDDHCDGDNQDDHDRKESLLLNESSHRLLSRHRGGPVITRLPSMSWKNVQNC